MGQFARKGKLSHFSIKIKNTIWKLRSRFGDGTIHPKGNYPISKSNPHAEGKVCHLWIGSHHHQCAQQTMVDIIYTHMYIISTWPESKIDAKERVSEVFPAIKLQNYKWLMTFWQQLDNSGWHQAVLPPGTCHVFCSWDSWRQLDSTGC